MGALVGSVGYMTKTWRHSFLATGKHCYWILNVDTVFIFPLQSNSSVKRTLSLTQSSNLVLPSCLPTVRCDFEFGGFIHIVKSYEALRGKKHNCEATYHRACLPPSRRPGLSRAEEAEWRCDRCEVKHTAYRAKEEALEEEREAAASQGAIEQESFEDPESEVTRAALAKARAPVPKMVFGRREKYREAKAREDERLLLIGGAAKRPRAKKPKNSTPQVRTMHERLRYLVLLFCRTKIV